MGWHSSAAAGRGALDSGATDGDAVLSGYLAGRWGMEGCSGARAASCASSEVTREEPISLPRKPTKLFALQESLPGSARAVSAVLGCPREHPGPWHTDGRLRVSPGTSSARLSAWALGLSPAQVRSEARVG